MWKWSFDLQRDLGFNTQLTVGYVGHAMRHVGNSMRNWNSPAPSPDSNFQANRPFPRFYDPATPELGVQNLSTVRYLDTYQNAFHHGLQMELKKRYSSGFMFGVAYTFSKTHGDGEAGGNQGAQIQQPRLCRHCDRGRLRFDQTQYLVANFVWDMPGSNLPGALKHIIGGWQSNGIISLRTGFPYSIRARQGDLNVREEHPRPDLVGQPAFAGQNRKLWYQPSAFQRVTCRIPERQDLCHFGDLGYNVLDSPGQRRVDFGLFKNFQLTERFQLQFRSEYYNALNTPYFTQPSSNLSVFFVDPAHAGRFASGRDPRHPTGHADSSVRTEAHLLSREAELFNNFQQGAGPRGPAFSLRARPVGARSRATAARPSPRRCVRGPYRSS